MAIFFRSGGRMLAALFLLAAALAGLAWTRLGAFERHTMVLHNARGMPLRVVLFEPREARRPLPAIVVCQPFNSPPEAGLALILEFVRRGMLVATFDFRGQTPAENRVLLRDNLLAVTALDAAAVLSYLRGRSEVDRARIGLIGHSAGGTLAIRAGIEQPWVRAVVAVGIDSAVTRNLPQNLLWLVGLYDEFRPLSEMQAAMEASNSEAIAEINRRAGDFQQGTARELAVTGTADHFTEFLNHGTALRAVEWFENAFGGRVAPSRRLAVAPWFYASYSLAFLFGWLFLFRIAGPGSAGAGSGLPNKISGRWFTAAMSALLLVLIAVPLPRLSLLRADLAMWGLALLIAVNFRRHLPAGQDLRGGRRIAWVLLLGWASFLITLVINQVAYFWRYPYLLYGLPAFPFWHLTGALNSYFFTYPRVLLFSRYTGAVLRPAWPFWALLLVELLKPGAILGTIYNVLRRIRTQESAVPAPRRRIAAANLIAWAVVLALFAALGGIVAMRAAQGFVDSESLRQAAWAILRFALPPFFIFALLKRLVLRTRREKREAAASS